MKYFMSTLTVFVICFLTTSFEVRESNKLKTGFYYLAEKESEGVLIKDIDSDDTYAVEQNEILTVTDFTAAKMTTVDFQPKPMNVIVVKLTKEGRKKWASIIKRIETTGESIVFVCNDKVYIEKRIIGKGSLPYNSIDLYIETQYQEAILRQLQTEITNQ